MKPTLKVSQAMGSYEYYTELFPLVLILVDGTVDAEMAQKYWDMEDEWIRDGKIYAAVTDLTSSGMATKEYRSAIAERLKDLKDTIPDACMGTALVIKSPVIRLALNITLSVAPMPIPHKIVGTVEEGMDWVLEQLSKAGISAPDRDRGLEALAKLRGALPESLPEG